MKINRQRALVYCPLTLEEARYLRLVCKEECGKSELFDKLKQCVNDLEGYLKNGAGT